MNEFNAFLVRSIGGWGYFGIFVLMFLESSFFPFPSEVIMIPAGYLSYLGKLSLWVSILFGVIGSYAGALFNYFLAEKYGRKFLIKYGKYLFIDEKKLGKLEGFFKKHGHISTFNGRLIPGVRQYISLPAGLAKMNLFIFSVYTIVGAGIWVSILTFLGYFIGDKKDLIKKYSNEITILIIIFVVIITLVYWIYYKKKNHIKGEINH
ncbi:MAG TPA: DedA family protein [bacterium]|nr:DedA family protein [bacterium]